MAKMFLRSKEAALVLGVSRMTLNMWDRKKKIKKVIKNRRVVYYVVRADIQTDCTITNAKPVRPKNASTK
jgi:predicted site-specific integrase-resolvase